MGVKDRTYNVTFQPEGRSVLVPAGTFLYEAAAQAGIALEVPCGAQGRCGRCRVRVEGGEVSQRENPHLTREEIEQGWVLSCVARVAGDLFILIPPKRERDKAIQESAFSRSALPIRLDWPRTPFVRRLFVELEPPSLEDNATDLDRLRRALRQEHGIEELSLDLASLRGLPQTLRDGEWRATAILGDGDSLSQGRLLDLRPGRVTGPLLGIAVDIGTTTVVVYLVDLRNGRLIDRASAFNKQISCGEDIISRIVYSQRGQGLEQLRRMAVETINELLAELSAKNGLQASEIHDMVVAGNTTMIHLFLGIPPRHIREEPYAPVAVRFPPFRAGELEVAINPQALVHCLPAVAAYVGGDITAGVLSSGLHRAERLTLFMDVGTNGELVLGNSDWMVTCACSAGPAFEGAGVRCGMRASAGAIQDVSIHSLTLEPTISVIEDVAPLGLCGSGMISALAEMFITGIIDKSGHIDLDFVGRRMGEGSRARIGEHGREYVLVWASESGTGEDITLSEVDINNLIRTKGAIYAGITVMASQVGVKLSDIEEVLIGGAFGQHVNLERAIQIGLLPDLPWDRFKFLGNTSALGAYNALLSKQARAKAEEIAGKMTYLELIADNSFMNEFTSALFLPHTDLDSFPTVKTLISEQNLAQALGPPGA